MNIIMKDILALLNIEISSKECLSQKKIINHVENNYKELISTVISTRLNYDKNACIITPFGLKNSKRESKNFIVLFGYERKNNIKTKQKFKHQ